MKSKTDKGEERGTGRENEREIETPNGRKVAVISAAAIKPVPMLLCHLTKHSKTGKWLENRSRIHRVIFIRTACAVTYGDN